MVPLCSHYMLTLLSIRAGENVNFSGRENNCPHFFLPIHVRYKVKGEVGGSLSDVTKSVNCYIFGGKVPDHVIHDISKSCKEYLAFGGI